jgi:hypothetical protein
MRFIAGMAVGLAILLSATVVSAGEDAALPANVQAYCHINSLVVTNPESPIQGIHHFYANNQALATILQGVDGGSYPEGSIFVGVVYKPVKSPEGYYQEGKKIAYTYMEKAPGDPQTQDTGGWRFAMFGPDGRNKGVDPAESCFSCHRPQPETDYVLSEPLRVNVP